ncbi:MAG TPA: hypothetical protein VNN79_13055, partial [Actinomycetota bacterium]|nr:hypothetical protein [Actinomycetota bacterium]
AVDVQNTISGRQVIAQNPWNNFIQGNNVATLTLFPPPAGTTDLAVTSFTIMNTGDVPATITVETASKVGGACQVNGGGTLTELSVGPNSTSHVEYPQPLVAHLTTNQCVVAEVNGDGATRITGVGFTQ